MRKRPGTRWRNRNPVSLFSFIDIMGGLIGALSLIIISISLSDVVHESSFARPIDTQRLMENQIQQKQAQINSLRKTIAEINKQKSDMQQATRNVGTLQQRMDQLTARQSNLAGVLEEKHLLNEQIKVLESELKGLRTAVAGLDKTAHEKTGQGIRDKIEVHLTGRGRQLKPTFVECTEKGLVIQDGDVKQTINNRIISTSDKFRLLLEQAKERKDGTVIFLIRPDGIGSFNRAMERTKQYEVRSGKLPVPGSGEIDLSHYNE